MDGFEFMLGCLLLAIECIILIVAIKCGAFKWLDKSLIEATNKLNENEAYREIAQAAIEKQTPHKARDISGDGIERYVCECGNLMHRKQAYCEKCGQRLEV